MSLARQFLLLSFGILLAGMLIIGTWMGRQIEASVVNRAAAVTALYVDSFVAPHLQGLARSGELQPGPRAALESLMAGTPLGQSIVSLKVWGRDGRILYSSNPALTGRTFALTPALAQALQGEVQARISDLKEPENEYERAHWSRLMEIYAPIRAEGTGTVVGVSEFYKATGELESDIRTAQYRSWIIVGVATIAMYLLLAGLVRRASNTIFAQQGELRSAAARTAALNERLLHRVAADLHDGPGQDLGLALLRIGALAEACERCAVATTRGRTVQDDFRTVHCALESALSEMRSICGGLRLPELDALDPAQVVERAVSEYRRKTGQTVAVTLSDVPPGAPLPVKITLYRLLQESLANGLRHAGGAGQSVKVAGHGGILWVEVADKGPGLDPKAAHADGRLGLVGMRERVGVLGGTFEVASTFPHGTTIRARLPLCVPGLDA